MKRNLYINSVIPCLVKDVPGTLEGQVEAQEVRAPGPEPRRED